MTGVQRPPRILAAAALSGAQSLAAQALLAREAMLLYGGNEVAVGVFLALWLAGISLGAWGGLQLGPRVQRIAPWALAASLPLLLGCFWLAHAARALSGVPAYEAFPLSALLLWTAPIALPVSLATGLCLPGLAALRRMQGGTATGVYVAEAAGSFAGGAGATLALAFGAGPGALALGCGAAGALAAALVFATNSRRVGACVVALLAVAAACLPGAPLDGPLRALRLDSELPGAMPLAAADTPTASLVLARLGDAEVLLADGAPVASFGDADRAERGAGLWAAVTGGPRRALLVGLSGADLVPGALALQGLERLVWVVPDAGVRAFALRRAPGADDPRVRFLVGDPLKDPQALAAEGPFDAVWMPSAEALTRAGDRLLSARSLEALASSLTPGGVMALSAEYSETYAGPRVRNAVGVAAAGLREALGPGAALRLTPGDTPFLLGVREGFSIPPSDPGGLHAAYLRLLPLRVLLSPEDFAVLLPPSRAAGADALLAGLLADPDARPASLGAPNALYRNLLVRAERESPRLAAWIESVRNRRAVWAAPALALALVAAARVLSRRRRTERTQSAAAVLLAASGAAGMGLNLALLDLYQGRFGTLYGEVGWLFGLWMAGYALGGLGLGRLAKGDSPFPAPGAAALGGMALFGAFLALGTEGALPTRWLGALAFAAAGTLTGAAIPLAEGLWARAGVRGGDAGARLGQFDALGGGLGALAFGVGLLPLAGTAASGWAVAALAAFALGIGLLGVSGASLPLGFLRRARAGAFLWTLAGLGAAAVAWHGASAWWIEGPKDALDRVALEASGLKPPWREDAEPTRHYRGADGGVALAARAQGYGGSLRVLAATDAKGRITRVGWLEHRETAAYVEGAQAFFSSLEGLDLTRSVGLGRGEGGRKVEGQTVDGITGATVTSRAVLAALENSGRALAQPVFARPFVSDAVAEGLAPRWWYVAASLALLPFVHLHASRRQRRAWLALHVGVGGLWLSAQLTTVQALSLLRGEPGWNLSEAGALLALGAWLSALAFGPVYCGHLCPAGAAQELVSDLAGWLPWNRGGARNLPRRASRLLPLLKYALLAGIVVSALVWAGGEGGSAQGASFGRLDALRTAWTGGGGWPAGVFLGLALAGSLAAPRFFCRFLCPTGAFLNLGNLAGARLFPRPRQLRSCPLGVRDSGPLECLQCNRCLDAPPVREASNRRAALTVCLVALCLGLMLARPSSDGAGAFAPGAVPARVEAVDAPLLRGRMNAGRLSDHPALYWREGGGR